MIGYFNKRSLINDTITIFIRLSHRAKLVRSRGGFCPAEQCSRGVEICHSNDKLAVHGLETLFLLIDRPIAIRISFNHYLPAIARGCYRRGFNQLAVRPAH